MYIAPWKLSILKGPNEWMKRAFMTFKAYYYRGQQEIRVVIIDFKV